jgi:DNA-binding transcriptional ArsR family regulator
MEETMAGARLFQALSDPTRLKIMSILADGPMIVSGMVKRLGCAQPAVSRHLRVLRDVTLIQDKRRGKEVEYSLNLTQLAGTAKYLQDLLRAAQAAGGRGVTGVDGAKEQSAARALGTETATAPSEVGQGRPGAGEVGIAGAGGPELPGAESEPPS